MTMIDSAITHEITIAKQEALYEVVSEIIFSIKRHNYQVEDILEALVQYTKQRDDWQDVTAHLNAAKDAVISARAHLTRKEIDQ